MAEYKSGAKVVFTVNVNLSEEEARALHVLPSYGTDEFIAAFYKVLGKHYLEKHEQGLRSLFKTVNDQLGKHISCVDKTRKTFSDNYPN